MQPSAASGAARASLSGIQGDSTYSPHGECHDCSNGGVVKCFFGVFQAVLYPLDRFYTELITFWGLTDPG